LIVDPPSNWHTADDALRGMREWNFSSENALMYFPRMLAHDKLRGHFESFAPCGAVAGMLARCDEASPVWMPAKNDEAILRPGYRPTCLITEDRRHAAGEFRRQHSAGGALASPHRREPAHLGRRLGGQFRLAVLQPRRLALFIVNSIERGTRWVAMARPHVEVAETAAAQIRAFFEGLHEAHSLRRAAHAGGVFRDLRPGQEFKIMIGFAAQRKPGFTASASCMAPRAARSSP
jgi:hypothetical protein